MIIEFMGWSALGAILMATAVMLGAFGAHGLRGMLDPYSMGVYDRAVFYHFVHAIGLLVVPLFVRVGALSELAGRRIAMLLAAGIVLFSGSLYLLAVSGVRILGAVTPFGGVAFITAWALLAYGLYRGGRIKG